MPFTERPAVILLVDDSDAVRLLMVRLLTRVGFHVLEAASGQAALDTLANLGEPIDLLVTDYSLPDMSGVELAAHIQTIVPAVHTLYVSGRGDFDLASARGEFLAKPFAADQLLSAVSRLLEQRGEETLDL